MGDTTVNDTAFEERLRDLEAVEAIQALKADYCYRVDAGDAPGVAARFLEDAVWHAPGIGRYEGRAAIEKFLASLPEMMRFWLHLVTNPLIEVTGDTARGRWYLIEPNTLKDGRAVWGTGRYEERYRRRDGQWYFEEVALLPAFWSPYDKGWAALPNLFDRATEKP